MIGPSTTWRWATIWSWVNVSIQSEADYNIHCGSAEINVEKGHLKGGPFCVGQTLSSSDYVGGLLRYTKASRSVKGVAGTSVRVSDAQVRQRVGLCVVPCWIRRLLVLSNAWVVLPEYHGNVTNVH
jgi:hypothetical protein